MSLGSTVTKSPTDQARFSSSGKWGRLDDLFSKAVDAGLLSGAVTMLWHGNALAHQTTIGRLDVARPEPMQGDTIFRIYSMTKPVTAVAMMILWDEGKWSPADPLARHLPELRDLKIVDDAGTTRPARSQPTLEHLMTHQAGFTYGFGNDVADCAFRAAGIPILPHSMAADEYLARLATVPLAFEPGTGWRYSVAMDVQGIIVERLSGMSLHDFMRERIFAPLKMEDTDFVVPPAKRDRLAALYTLDGDTLVDMSAEGTSLQYDNMAELSASDLVLQYDEPPLLASGGGGLVSTAPDYLRFARMLLGRGELEGVRILSEAAVKLMTSSHTPAHLLNGSFGTAPHDLRPGYEYAYNGVVITDPGAAEVALGRGTYFWDGAAGCWFWSDPTNEVAFVAMIQLLTDAEKLSLQFQSRGLVASIMGQAQG